MATLVMGEPDSPGPDATGVPDCTPGTGGINGMYGFAYCYLEGSTDYMIYIYGQLVAANRYVAKMTSFYFNVAIPLYLAVASVSKAPYAGLGVINSMIGLGMDALASASFIQVAQKMLLRFFENYSLSFFLPLGLILRTFSFSRKLGATLIAIAIGTYVVYPLSIVFAAGVYDQVDKHVEINLPHEPPDLHDTAICNPFIQNFMWLGSIFWWYIWFSGPCATATVGWWACMLANYPNAQLIYSAVNSVFLLAYVDVLWDYATADPSDIYNAIADPTNPNNALNAVSHNAMITAVLAVFSIILTVVTTRSLSIQLGGDTEFYGIYKLI
ncbi:hypothetical protein DRN67_03000 [Candidatus Micrarchaeota archaeon]|nr:MAG: hypothetical protein DRN67_03000 [Candidatus Micrarchaeota archaeon]